MIDFSPFHRREQPISALTSGLTVDDLRELTNAITDAILALIADCTDADVVFQPEDPHAHDAAASSADEVNMPWTLGHVIAHLTAGNEESAALAAELARGVAYHGRSRAEVPWETIRTVAQCRRRLEESRRMCLASLGMWPDQPRLDVTYTPFPAAGEVNAIGRYMLGIAHAESHLEQIRAIIRQARAARPEVRVETG